ncbi:MAG: HAD-IA family hydrolase, partial [Prevotellaceae bacterium]|nr:HAD-IA family hydrolase [Prevotellaceae bacterium]
MWESFPSVAHNLRPDVVDVVRAFVERSKLNSWSTHSMVNTTAAMIMAMKKLRLERYFQVVVSADHITKGKPDPMCYLLAASQLQSAPEECLVFEDSLAGVAAGKRA